MLLKEARELKTNLGRYFCMTEGIRTICGTIATQVKLGVDSDIQILWHPLRLSQ